MDDNTLHMTILFDFYGELLTDKQKEYFDLYHNEDLSLSEIAEKAKITRNGVYDIIKRAEKILTEFELKTGLAKKWLDTRQDIEEAIKLTKEIKQSPINNINDLTNKLLKLLENIQ